MSIINLDYPIEILIADKDFLYRKIIIDFLQEDSNFKVTGEAKDGKTAVSLATELKPDIVIIDLGISVMSGIEAIIKIKAINPFIKVIALTTYVDQNEAVESFAAGVMAYASKDININQMKMIIETVNDGAVWISPFVGKKILQEGIKNLSKKLK